MCSLDDCYRCCSNCWRCYYLLFRSLSIAFSRSIISFLKLRSSFRLCSWSYCICFCSSSRSWKFCLALSISDFIFVCISSCVISSCWCSSSNFRCSLLRCVIFSLKMSLSDRILLYFVVVRYSAFSSYSILCSTVLAVGLAYSALALCFLIYVICYWVWNTLSSRYLIYSRSLTSCESRSSFSFWALLVASLCCISAYVARCCWSWILSFKTWFSRESLSTISRSRLSWDC